MSVTQDHPGNTPSLEPSKKPKKSRAEYARKRRANCGEVMKALREIQSIIAKLDGAS
jgi:hypothetical protein